MTDDPAKVLLKKFYYRRVTRWGSKSYTEDKFLRDVLDERKNRERLTLISNRLGSNLGDSCILELGCGFGSMIITLKTLGIECYGIEPDGEILKVATLRIKTKGLENVVAKAVGEHLPYVDETFDLVTSFQTLEHVKYPEDVLKESIRVLKKKGILFMITPNYNSFWEGHYGVFWMPFFTKRLARIYLRILRRNPRYLDEITFMTPKKILKALKSENVDVITVGYDIWEEKFDSMSWLAWGETEKVFHVAKLIHKLNLSRVVKFLIKRLGAFYPIILIARKR